MEDRDITCVQCQTPFVFTAKDQQFYTERGFQDPKRCKGCRENRSAKGGGASSGRAPRQGGGDRPRGGGGYGGGGGGYGGGGRGGDRGPRQTFPAVCAACGQDTEVPFAPKGDRPVYCRNCFRERKPSSV